MISGCLNNIIKLGCIGLVLLVIGALTAAQMGGLGWTVGFIIGLAIIGSVFKS